MQLKSLSSYIAPVLKRPGLQARVDSVFAEAVTLVVEPRTYWSLVSERAGNGPLNAVVQSPALLTLLRCGDQVTGDGRRLRLASGWRLSLSGVSQWNAYPSYQRLAQNPQVVRASLDRLRSEVSLKTPPASLAAAASPHARRAFANQPAMAQAQAQAQALGAGLRRSYRRGDLPGLQAFARQLAGLGPGLTPAGDDWLAGWLVGLRVQTALPSAEQQPALTFDAVAQAVVEAAADQTTGLSLAFLQAAAAGAVSQGWHSLLAALLSADPAALAAAVAEVMRHGSTSGADMLAGFLAAFQTEDA